MSFQRGRPRILSEVLVKSTIFKYAKEIVTNDNKIISKTNQIWIRVAEEIGQIHLQSVYTLVVNNQFDIRTNLIKETGSIAEERNEVSTTSSILDRSAMSASSSVDSPDEEKREVEIIFDKEEFDSLIETKQYPRSENKRRKLQFRKYQVLKSGKWQNAITTKLWETCKLQYGYQFKRNKIFNDTQNMWKM